MNIAAIIIGIDGWEKYTLPLIESIQKHEPECEIVVIDNESKEPYPWESFGGEPSSRCVIIPTHRMSYSAAINWGKFSFDEWAKIRIPKPQYDWYIVLSNDVLCTGPFAAELAKQDGEAVVGPLMKNVHGFDYLEGWCVCVPAKIWDAVGGWDERFLGSDYEDVAFSTAARQKGFWLEEAPLPFVHLDQGQRYHVVDDFAGKNAHNRELFLREYAAVTA